MSGLLKSGDRAKVACVNWGHPRAPKAVSYILSGDEMFAERFHDTWADAVERSRKLARLIRKVEERA